MIIIFYFKDGKTPMELLRDPKARKAVEKTFCEFVLEQKTDLINILLLIFTHLLEIACKA